MFEIIKSGTNWDFVGKRKLWGAISVAAIAITVILLFTKGLNYGIDFTGGAEIQLKAPQSWDIGKLRGELEGADLKGLRVQQIGDATESTFLVRAQGDEKSLNEVNKRVEEVLKAKSPTGFEFQRIGVVGPAAGESLRKSGFLSMLYALLCILIYVTIRFDFRYSPGAVIALLHDTMVTLGVLVIFGKTFDLQVLASLLALIGYSNNDTIIVYDRVRETLHDHPELSIEKAVNRAINETLGRTFLTSFCTLITVLALYLFGGKVIEDFAFTFMVGIVVGTYSSIFIASSLVIWMTQYLEGKELKNKMGGGAVSKKVYSPRPEPKLEA